MANGYQPGTDEERKLVRKIDLFLMPNIFIMYLLSYMDRTNIGNAKIAGMAHDLNLDSARYSVVLVVFFAGYVAMEVPSNMLLTKIGRPSIFLPCIMFLWGCMTIGMGFVNSYHGVIAFRVVIGCLEAGFAPGVLLVLSSWYKKAEQSRRFSIYIGAAILSGAFGGLIGGGITDGMEGTAGLRGWRWLFIVEGALTSAWSIIAYFLLLDFPANEKSFSPRERELAMQRIAYDQLTVQVDGPEIGHLKALLVAARNWRLWAFTVGYMTIVGSSTLSYFYPTLVQGLGYSSRDAQYMTVPIYMVAFVATAFSGYYMDRFSHNRGWALASWMGLALICSACVLGIYNFVARYVLLVFMAAGLWASNAIALSYASSTFGEMPNEVRAISLAFVNAMGNLASIYGAYLYPSKQAPKYMQGFGVTTAMCALGICIYIFLQIMLKRRPATQKVY
ncbi:major facilitator superfamily domain-containing protein [Bisporella sp. PMI_857]|nr:major facilitator superfamily domain-containing protein [Bisporella sp. PMI_857]